MALPLVDDGSEQRMREIEAEYTEFLDDSVRTSTSIIFTLFLLLVLLVSLSLTYVKFHLA